MVKVALQDGMLTEQRDKALVELVEASPRSLAVFVSDSHLGSGTDSRERERELCVFLDSVKRSCSQLFLLGDMFDFWFTYRHVVPRGYTRLLGKLAELADSGVEVHFFLGNHDMWLFDYLEAETGVVMHDEPEVFTIDGRQFLIGHGDGLGHLDRRFDLLRRVFRSPFNQRLFALLPPSWTFPIAHRWSDSNKLMHAKQDCLRYMGDDREGIVLYCKERLKAEHLDYCVFGHRHTPLTRRIGLEGEGRGSDGSGSTPSPSALYVNTGDWLLGRNYAVYSLEKHEMGLYDLYKGQLA